MNSWKPDRTTTYTIAGGKQTSIIAESISQTGKAIVVTRHKRRDGKFGYGLTHTGTGATLTGCQLFSDIAELKKRARAFWRALNAEQKKIWKQSTSVTEVQNNTPAEAVQIVRRNS